MIIETTPFGDSSQGLKYKNIIYIPGESEVGQSWTILLTALRIFASMAAAMLSLLLPKCDVPHSVRLIVIV